MNDPLSEKVTNLKEKVVDILKEHNGWRVTRECDQNTTNEKKTRRAGAVTRERGKGDKKWAK